MQQVERERVKRPSISTVKEIENLKPELMEYAVKDAKTEGLWLNVKPSGTKSWTLFYSFGGKQRKLTLGPLPLAEARKKVAEARILIAEGLDPASAKRAYKKAAQANQRQRKALPDRRKSRPAPALDGESNTPPPAIGYTNGTVEAVVEAYLECYCKPAKRRNSYEAAARLLRTKFVKRFRGRRFSELTKADFDGLLQAVADEAPISSNRLHAELSTLSKWMCGEKQRKQNPETKVWAKAPPPELALGHNPFLNVKKKVKENPGRERVLERHELRLIWKAADSLGFPFGDFAKFLLLTGQRRAEVCGLSWQEIDMAKQEWTLPNARSKNGKGHVIPLSPSAISVLESVERFVRPPGAPDYVFSSGAKAQTSYSRAKEQMDKAVRALNGGNDLAQWGFHDFRRSVATYMAALGIAPHIIDKILNNHQSGVISGVAAIYNRHSYLVEKREALDRWAGNLRMILIDIPAKRRLLMNSPSVRKRVTRKLAMEA